MRKIRVHNDNPPVCPECGNELACKDVRIDPDNGDRICICEDCTSNQCKAKIYQERLNPKYYYAGVKG